MVLAKITRYIIVFVIVTTFVFITIALVNSIVFFIRSPLFAYKRLQLFPQKISQEHFNQIYFGRCEAESNITNETQKKAYVSKLFETINTRAYFDFPNPNKIGKSSDFSLIPDIITNNPENPLQRSICWKLVFIEPSNDTKQIGFLNKYGIYEVYRVPYVSLER